MKRNIRAFVTYAVLGVLCVAALVAYGGSKGWFASPAAAMTASASALSGTASADASSGAHTASAQATADSTAATATPPTATILAAGVNPFARSDGDAHNATLMAAAIQMPAQHVVGIAQGGDYSAVVRAVMENAGGLKELIKPGSNVLIKPNLIAGRPQGSPVCTDPRVIQAIADIAYELGAGKVIVAEASPAGDAFQMAEYDKLQGVQIVDLNKSVEEDCYVLKADGSQTDRELYIPKVYMDADVVIGAAKLKTHFQPEARVSLGLKLSMGVPPTGLYGSSMGKIMLHNMGLKEVIIDLNRIRRPDFMFIDGIVAGEGYGPLANEPVQADIMFAGSDIVALDTVALTYMGFSLDEVPHVKLAADLKMGESDLSKITVVGAELDKIKTRFRRANE